MSVVAKPNNRNIQFFTRKKLKNSFLPDYSSFFMIFWFISCVQLDQNIKNKMEFTSNNNSFIDTTCVDHRDNPYNINSQKQYIRNKFTH